MRVLLIHPQRPGLTGLKKGWHDKFSSMEPMGICYLAGSLRQSGYQDVTVVDRGTTGQTDLELLEFVQKLSPDVLGISVNACDMPFVSWIAPRVRDCSPGTHMTLGGYHPSFIPEQLLRRLPEVDSVVVGDGCDTIVELCQAVSGSKSLDSVQGVAHRDGEQVVAAVARSSQTALEDLPLPARDVLRCRQRQGDFPVARVLTSIGCPMDCTFCTDPAFKRLRPGMERQDRTADSIIAEIEALRQVFGLKAILFCATSFMPTDPKYRKEIVRVMRYLSTTDIQFRIMERASTIIREENDLLPLMVEAGLERVFIGLESGSNSALRRFNKGCTAQMNLKACRIIQKYQLPAQNGFIMMDPYSTFDELRESICFLASIGEHYVKSMVTSRLELQPGMSMLESIESDGLLVRDSETLSDSFGYRFKDQRVECFCEDLRGAFDFEEANILEGRIIDNRFALYKLGRLANDKNRHSSVLRLESRQNILQAQLGGHIKDYFEGLLEYHKRPNGTSRKPDMSQLRESIIQQLQTAEDISEQTGQLLSGCTDSDMVKQKRGDGDSQGLPRQRHIVSPLGFRQPGCGGHRGAGASSPATRGAR